MNAVMTDPGVRDLLAKQGLIVGGGTPAEFKALAIEESVLAR